MGPLTRLHRTPWIKLSQAWAHYSKNHKEYSRGKKRQVIENKRKQCYHKGKLVRLDKCYNLRHYWGKHSSYNKYSFSGPPLRSACVLKFFFFNSRINSYCEKLGKKICFQKHKYNLKIYNTLSQGKYHPILEKHLEMCEGIFDAPKAAAENRSTKF